MRVQTCQQATSTSMDLFSEARFRLISPSTARDITEMRWVRQVTSSSPRRGESVWLAVAPPPPWCSYRARGWWAGRWPGCSLSRSRPGTGRSPRQTWPDQAPAGCAPSEGQQAGGRTTTTTTTIINRWAVANSLPDVSCVCVFMCYCVLYATNVVCNVHWWQWISSWEDNNI